MDDPYVVLGVATDAPRDEIRRAYRKLARATHPDRNPDDPEAEARFKEVAAAWEILGDEAARRRYDQARGETAGPAVPDEVLDAVASAVERAQDWCERGVLPQWAARWRGRGAAAAGWALRHLDELSRPGPLPQVGVWAARRARAQAQRVAVGLAPWPMATATHVVRRVRGWEILIDPHTLWAHGFRGTDLDDAVMRLLVARYVQILSVGVFWPPAAGDPDDDDQAWAEALADASRRDDERVRQRALRIGGWLLVAAILGLMFTAGYNDW